jgi:CO dehydrogenase/acetyl-CoA synthase beta subunit
MKLIIFCSFFFTIIAFSQFAHAQDMVFPNFESNVTQLEMELKLFDLKANYHSILPNELQKYISNISSLAFTEKRIDSYVRVNQSILKGSLADKKKRLNKFCDALFGEYQKNFTMIDKFDLKALSGKGAPVKFMDKSNLAIHIYYTSGTSPKYIAEWDSGSMSFKEGFFAEY